MAGRITQRSRRRLFGQLPGLRLSGKRSPLPITVDGKKSNQRGFDYSPCRPPLHPPKACQAASSTTWPAVAAAHAATIDGAKATGQTSSESSREPILNTRGKLALGDSRHRTIGVAVAPQRGPTLSGRDINYPKISYQIMWRQVHFRAAGGCTEMGLTRIDIE